MSAVIVIQHDAAAGGSDVIPAALDWADIVVTSPDVGIESNDALSVTAIDTPIQIKAAWTSTSSSPAKAQWLKNDAADAALAVTPVTVSASLNNTLAFQMSARNSPTAGNYDTGTVRVTNESRTATITVTIASPAVVTWTAHGLSAGDKILFRTTGALPTGMTTETVYYVIAAGLGADVFEFSTTAGGAAVNTSGSQSGTHTGVSVLDTFAFAVQYVYGGLLP
jgi:hypothetical protein